MWEIMEAIDALSAWLQEHEKEVAALGTLLR